MKGLLIKDVYSMKGFGLVTAMIILLYAVISFITGNVSMLTSMMLVFSAIMPMSATSIDEVAKWNPYVQCMPVSRKTVVRAKYVFVLVIIAAAMGFALLVTALTALRAPLNWGETLMIDGLIVCMMLIVNSLTIPAIYKFGVEKARLVTILIFLICMMPFLALMGSPEEIANIPRWTFMLVPVIAVAAMIISYFVSVKVYQNKEL